MIIDTDLWPGPDWNPVVTWDTWSPHMKAGDIYVNKKWTKGYKPLYWLCTGDPKKLVQIDEELAFSCMTEWEISSATTHGPVQTNPQYLPLPRHSTPSPSYSSSQPEHLGSRSPDSK